MTNHFVLFEYPCDMAHESNAKTKIMKIKNIKIRCWNWNQYQTGNKQVSQKDYYCTPIG